MGSSFTPPFCPNPRATTTFAPPAGTTCGSVSSPALSTAEHPALPLSTLPPHLQHPDLLHHLLPQASRAAAPLFHRLLACSGYRQIARELRPRPRPWARRPGSAAMPCSSTTCARRTVSRTAVDGFESFAYSQYHPLHLNLAVGAESHFVYGFTHAELRRKGRMTPPSAAAASPSKAPLAGPIPGRSAPRSPSSCGSRSPRRPGRSALRRAPGLSARAFGASGAGPSRHQCTPSVAARTPGNPLFPVNLMDLLLRHNSANHKRETIAFSKRHQSVVERAALLDRGATSPSRSRRTTAVERRPCGRG